MKIAKINGRWLRLEFDEKFQKFFIWDGILSLEIIGSGYTIEDAMKEVKEERKKSREKGNKEIDEYIKKIKGEEK